MNIDFGEGRVLLAVSGGIDSVVMLHLALEHKVNCAVAHVDHGIRASSHEDASFVRTLCEEYGLDFYETRFELGEDASEEQARLARYSFLKQMQQDNGFDAIVTAHHFDDVIETAIINILRGTGRQGFSSLSSTESLRRPLLEYTKADIRRMAHDRQLKWREDETNSSDDYLRNRIRNHIVPRMGKHDAFSEFAQHVSHVRKLNEYINAQIDTFDSSPDSLILNRYFYTMIDGSVAREIMHYLIVKKFGVYLDARRLHILYRFVRTGGITSKCVVHPDLAIVARTKTISIDLTSKS